MAGRDAATELASSVADQAAAAEAVDPSVETEELSTKPMQRKGKGGATAYHVDRLVPDAEGLLGFQPHVAAGAFHGAQKQYWTVDEATERIEEWLQTPVGPEGEE